MSNLGMAGFERFHRKDEFKTPTREDLEKYFEETFYHKPTKEQLELFLKFLTGEEKDVEQVLDFCSKAINQVQLEK